MRKLPAILLVVSVLFLQSCASAKDKVYLSAPSMVPGTQPQMKSPGFWISLNPSPDKVILAGDGIKNINSAIENKLKLTRDITKIPEDFGKDLGTQFQDRLKAVRKRGLFLANGSHGSGRFFRKIKTNMAIDQLAYRTAPQYGFVVHDTAQRILPTDAAMTEIQGDVDFDEMQNNSLDVGTPIAVFHTSADGEWYYSVTSQSEGWVHAKDIALGTVNDVKQFFSNRSFVVVISPKADLFLDEKMTDFYDTVHMGVAFPSGGKGGSQAAKVTCPVRQKEGGLDFISVYIRADQVHDGYLSYTARTIINQAFLLLNAPYGWGGMYGEQDCSAFLQEVFATIGVYLPRNSADQAKVGRLLGQFEKPGAEQEKIEALKKDATGGTTLLSMKGHIVLYLGMFQDVPYAIHETWAYREKDNQPRILDRAVVSSLYLGEGSAKGSLLRRASSIRQIEN